MCVCVCVGGGICTVVRYFCSFTIISAGQSKELDGSKMSCNSVGAHVEKEKAYSTWYSQAVSHPSTNQARPCSEIRRDRACSFFFLFLMFFKFTILQKSYILHLQMITSPTPEFKTAFKSKTSITIHIQMNLAHPEGRAQSSKTGLKILRAAAPPPTPTGRLGPAPQPEQTTERPPQAQQQHAGTYAHPTRGGRAPPTDRAHRHTYTPLLHPKDPAAIHPARGAGPDPPAGERAQQHASSLL